MTKKVVTELELSNLAIEAQRLLAQHKENVGKHEPCKICRSLRRTVIGAL